MQYVTLLRGVNVGGNSIIKMADLKSAVEKSGFKNVSTYIQSGNIIFESDENDKATIASKLEKLLTKEFHISASVIVITYEQFKGIVAEAPAAWREGNDLRRYIAFVREPVTPKDVLRETEPRKGIDFVEAGDSVLYMSTLLGGLTKTGFTKLVAKTVYKDITIRNYTTAQKLLVLMESRI